MNITLIAALSENRVIGKDGGLPWSLPDDLQHFKMLTLGKTLVMGHATARSIKRPLPKRTNIVLSRGIHDLPGFVLLHSMQEALAYARREGVAELCVIGGAQVYALFLPIATRLELTHVEAHVEGDTYFPYCNMEEWKCTHEAHHAPDARHAVAFRMASYERRS